MVRANKLWFDFRMHVNAAVSEKFLQYLCLLSGCGGEKRAKISISASSIFIKSFYFAGE